MSNFETSQKDYQEYAKLASSAESLIYSDPRSSLTETKNNELKKWHILRMNIHLLF